MKTKLRVAASLITVLAAFLAHAYCSRAEDALRRVEIVAQRFGYTPGEITLKKGVPVVIVLTSKDVAHGMKFKELNLDIKARSGKKSEVQFTPAKAGNFVGQCSVFCGSGHGTMLITLHVID